MTEPAPPASVWRFIWGGGIAALVAAAGNLWWFASFTQITRQPRPTVMSPEAIVAATVASVLLGAGIYLLLARGLVIATPLFVVGALAVAGASTVAAFMPVMPDGTLAPEALPMLAMPMHIWTGVCAAVIVPLAVHVGRARRA